MTERGRRERGRSSSSRISKRRNEANEDNGSLIWGGPGSPIGSARRRTRPASPPLPSLASLLRDEIRDLDSLPLSLSLETGPLTETHQIGIRGGTVGGIGKDGQSPSTSTSYGVNWDGNALVFENESHSERVDPATWNERREVWSLDETGRLQIVITNRGWDGPARRLTLLYRRP
jgi:hypothetical protein